MKWILAIEILTNHSKLDRTFKSTNQQVGILNSIFNRDGCRIGRRKLNKKKKMKKWWQLSTSGLRIREDSIKRQREEQIQGIMVVGIPNATSTNNELHLSSQILNIISIQQTYSSVWIIDQFNCNNYPLLYKARRKSMISQLLTLNRELQKPESRTPKLYIKIYLT